MIELLPILAAAAWMAPQSAGKSAWTQVDSKTGAFSVRLPGPPATRRENCRTGRGEVFTVNSLVYGGRDYVYAVSWQDAVPSERGKPAPYILANASAGLRDGMRAELVDGHMTGTGGYPGYEMTLRMKQGRRAWARTYAVNQRSYQLIAAERRPGEAELAPPEEVRRFFASFQLRTRTARK